MQCPMNTIESMQFDTAQRENLIIIKKLTAETDNWYVKFCDNGAVFQNRFYQKTVRKSYCNTKAQGINFYQDYNDKKKI